MKDKLPTKPIHFVVESIWFTTMAALRQPIEETLRKNGTLEDEIRGSTLDKQMFEGFKDKEAEQLRGRFILLNMFNESWIPAIKAGTYGRYELFDMARDSGQTQDVSKQQPDIVAKLKKQLQEINQSVMADAPDWGSTDQAEGERQALPAEGVKESKNAEDTGEPPITTEGSQTSRRSF